MSDGLANEDVRFYNVYAEWSKDRARYVGAYTSESAAREFAAVFTGRTEIIVTEKPIWYYHPQVLTERVYTGPEEASS